MCERMHVHVHYMYSPDCPEALAVYTRKLGMGTYTEKPHELLLHKCVGISPRIQDNILSNGSQVCRHLPQDTG